MSDIKYMATPKQWQFLTANKMFVGYGGARGGGKSWVLRLKAALLAKRYPGIRECIVRRTFVDVRKNHVVPMKKMLKGIATYNTQDKAFTFKNGSVIEFQYCDNENDVSHFQGVEWDVIFVDEATQMEEEWLKEIFASIRSSQPGMLQRVYITCNPGGPGHAYIKRLFVDRRFREGEDPDDYLFIQALVTDNRFLMETQPNYVKFLKNLPPKLRKAWLMGDWNIFQGQFFETFRAEPDVRAAIEAGENLTTEELKKQRRWTHVIAPFKPRDHWKIYRSLDWGYHRPFSMGYYTINEDGVIFRIAEFYGCEKENGESIPNTGLKWPPEKVFSNIQRFEREHPYLAGRTITGVADSACWNVETGVSIIDTAAKYGIYFSKSEKARVPGWMQCQYRLMFDEAGYPMFYVFETCTEFIRIIPTLQYDEHQDEDLDTDGEDHIADEWRYFCMSKKMTPAAPEPDLYAKYTADPLNQFTDRRN